VSALRARCPDCRTLTAVAIGADYQCHSCGREFAAGLVRVPRAWEGADETGDAARAELPWPEAATVDEPSLEAQIEATARLLPGRPLVLGGCGYAHVGAVRELTRRHGPLALVWLDPRPDPPPLRALLQAGDIERGDVVRRLPAASPERLYVAVHGSAGRAGELEPLFTELPRPLGAGFTGLVRSEENAGRIVRLAQALGL
jgi:hypothetical protein